MVYLNVVFDSTMKHEKRQAQDTWGASPAGSTLAPGAHPGTRQFFESVLQRRSTGEMRWLPQEVPFDELGGQRVLEVGCGAGYDAFALAEAGVEYVGIDLTAANPVRTRDHLALFNLRPSLAQADAEQLPFADASFDAVFSNGVLHHTPDLPASLREIARVLRPGGAAYLIVYHRDSIFYWVSLGLVDHLFRGGFRRETLAQRLSRIEYTTSGALPLVRVYGRREFRSLCRAAGLEVERIAVRKLAREDLPNVRGIRWLKSRLSADVLDRLGRLFGWYIVMVGRRPTSR